MKAVLRRIYYKFFFNPISLIVASSSGRGNISLAMQEIATHETALYVNECMSHVLSVDSMSKVHDVAISNLSIKDGLMLEFGVYSGNSINYIANKVKPSSVDGFDSFEGLPEFWRDGFGEGHFAVNGLPKVEHNVRLHKGWFDDTLPEYLSDIDSGRKVSYLHVDCDLYSSTQTIFQLLADKIVSGTIIVFDEYFNYPGWQNGEFKAFKEFIASSGRKYEYLTYNRLHEQVAVRIV